MNKTVLITGSQGMLATDLALVWARAGYKVTGLSHAQLDVTQGGQVRRALESYRPGVVINTPGIGVDTCQTDPEQGYRIHTWASRNMARICQEIGSSYVYISTCGLFGDEVKFYSEYDPVELKTNYARSKYLGETEAVQACQRSFLIRPGWLFGGAITHNRNFVYQRYLEAMEKPLLQSAGDKFGSPTYTLDLSKKILEIVESEESGLYHVTNSGRASRYDYVKQIVESFGIETPIEPVDSSQFPRIAPVPDCESLENMNIRFLGLSEMPSWQDAIERYVSTLKSTIQ